MASNTNNLGLLMKDPVADGNDTFNVETMLNENWRKIDGAIGDVTTPAQKMGLTGELSIGKALGVLAEVGNVHVWKKTTVVGEWGYSLFDLGKSAVHQNTSTSTSRTITYSDSVEIVDGQVALAAPKRTLSISYNTYTAAENLKGKFWYHESDTNGIKYMPPNAVISTGSNDRYMIVFASDVKRVDPTPPREEVENLTSVNPNAYQEGTVGNTTIEYLGALGDKARVEVGSYVGTGTYGSSNPNSLTFGFAPKIVIIEREFYFHEIAVFIRGLTLTAYSSVSTSGNSINLTWTGKTISWYSNGAANQLNLTPIESGSYTGKGKYFYIAIG